MVATKKSVLEPQRAAVDITGGYAADAFLRSAAGPDEWDRQAFIALIDTIINHHHVVYPLPNRGSLHADPETTLPMLISLAQNEALISPVSSTFAEDIPAPVEWLEEEFAGFLNWTPEVSPSLSSPWHKWSFSGGGRNTRCRRVRDELVKKPAPPDPVQRPGQL